MKICRKCKAEKPETEFSKQSSYKDGRTIVCKDCTNKKWHEKKAERLSKPEPWFIFD